MAKDVVEARDAQRLLRAVRLGEVHGDAVSERWAEALNRPDVRRRADLYAALVRCREWMNTPVPSAGAPAWERLRDGVYGVASRLVVVVQQTGQLLVDWGHEAQAGLQAVPTLLGAEPQLVALGPAHDLGARTGITDVTAGESRYPCALSLLSAKDGSVSIEVRMKEGDTGDVPSSWNAEIWEDDGLLQRLPAREGMVRFTRGLASGHYRLVLRVGTDRHEIGIDVA